MKLFTQLFGKRKKQHRTHSHPDHDPHKERSLFFGAPVFWLTGNPFVMWSRRQKLGDVSTSARQHNRVTLGWRWLKWYYITLSPAIVDVHFYITNVRTEMRTTVITKKTKQYARIGQHDEHGCNNGTSTRTCCIKFSVVVCIHRSFQSCPSYLRPP